MKPSKIRRAKSQPPAPFDVLCPMDRGTIGDVIDLFLKTGIKDQTQETKEDMLRALTLFRAKFGSHAIYSCKPLDLVDWIVGHETWKSDWTRKRTMQSVQRPFNFHLRQFHVNDAIMQWALEEAGGHARRTFVASGRQDPMTQTWVYELANPTAHVRSKILKPDWSFVFLNERGRPWTKSAIGLRLFRLRERAELPRDCKLYGLRHKFCTDACINGVHGKALAELAGHSSARMTEYYEHLAGNVDFLLDAAKQATRQRKRGGAA